MTHRWLCLLAGEPFHGDDDTATKTGHWAHGPVHCIGLASRLKQELVDAFGMRRCARESLVAEIGAAFLCVSAGVTVEPREDHSHYHKS